MKMARIESAVRLVLAFYEALNRHDVAAMMALLTDDCRFEHFDPPPDGAVYSGKDAIAGFWQGFFRESPQAHLDIEKIHGFGMQGIARWRCEWVDAAGNQRHLRGVDLFQERGGLLCEQHSYVKGAGGGK
ncbi:MAG: nuclear transport factor 2 family protein [Anaerolineae bacterium]|nr:nuclear transport factor 2 family protein [Anaerolineae bacterium]